MTDLLSLDQSELAELVESLGQPAYRARQLWRQMYQRGVTDPNQMSDLPGEMRRRLSERVEDSQEPLELQTSADGSTSKALLRLSDDELIETVLIRSKPRDTVCLSSQAGCAMGCVFCATGLQGLRRQLTVGEIMRQAILARSWSRAEGRELSHVVFMGMGEPLANYANVSRAIDRLTDPDGFAMSPRRITVSTVGIPQNIRRLAADHPRVNLAVSLHAPTQGLRRELVPVDGASVDDILDAVRAHNRETGGRVTFEYVLLRDLNDSRGHARRLAERIRGLRAHVNLIPLNPSPGVVGERPSRRASLGFQQALQESGVPTTIRVEQGRDIAAACGQLRGDRIAISE
ncbi:MAG: 23S rRNA (adenine(2503)-C(2))-methyltransferase RlmN [Chloroflexi bacterium]|nr:23S rRNA (adenine(2503)-C(2))-methyltransferase RlmN [Chloroflexota bacterium]MCY3587409.1 23S rRNA (adenine(2503)-C(2))-methyltransferase RlmN [Chloroflexota bacterium]MCY3685438.1 23S rRNA (adenine(2503)-C(2))-methyltransferase RlmN [Chloroflexota bacterium]MDE2708340.1 23S rRNA (adenine(2503)-C(2))-methyltransferase RlmN [Chloroflexota bacterium]